MQKIKKQRSPWSWVPTLYYAEGIPYVIVMTLSVIMYKRLGVSNSDIALYTSWLYLPWVIKPLWSPIVDILKTKRFWIIVMQLFIGAGLAGVAFTIPVPNYFQYTLAFFWLLAFSSATHDIAADGFYMLGLDEGNQAFFVGIRSTFYRLAMLTGQGLIVIVAGAIEAKTGEEPVFIHVQTVNQQEIVLPKIPEIKTSDEEFGFSFYDDIKIYLQDSDNKHIDSIVSYVKNQNLQNEFYKTEETITKNKEIKQSLWAKHLSNPLSRFLERTFGTNKKIESNGKKPNIGIACVKLNKKPKADENIVLNMSRYEGDKNLQIIEGTRFVFNESNWDKPAYLVFQADPKLEENVSTTFIGRSGNIKLAWTISFAILAILFIVFFVYHRFILPHPNSDKPNKPEGKSNFLKEFGETFASFFRKKNIGIVLAFLLLYRLGESQLVKLASPFLLDSTEAGGLGLTTGDLGIIYGTIGIIALSLGGILGGILVARNGLKYWLWWMILAMNLPNLVYVYLSTVMPDSFTIISLSVAVEQFGYGFGFTAYMMYMIYASDGKHKTAHFAIATGFMALGMMIPGMLSGWLQDIIGYNNFFIWVIICTIPGFIVTAFLKIDPKFGIKRKKKIVE